MSRQVVSKCSRRRADPRRARASPQCKLSESLTLNPDHFGRNLHASVVSLLTRKVMGKCISPYGMVVSVREVQVPKTARINEDTAEAEFRIRFEAIVLRPIVGEVLDAIVTSVSQVRTQPSRRQRPRCSGWSCRVCPAL